MTRARELLRRYWWAAGLLIGLVVVFAATRGTAVDVVSAPAERGEFVVDIETRGEIQAVDSRAVSRSRSSRSNSAIVQLAPEGSEVEEGDFLVSFDTSEEDRQVEERRNDLLNAQADLKQFEASSASGMAELDTALRTQEYSWELSKLRYERMEFEADIKRREQEIEYRKAELALDEARKRIEAQKIIDAAERSKIDLKVRQAELELEKAQEMLDLQTLHAPVGGLVVYKEIWRSGGRGKVKVGDTPWRGQELIELPDLSTMQVRTHVNEIDINRVDEGLAVEIEVDAIPDSTFHGTITHVATLARRERNSEVKNFAVDVLIEGAGEDLRPGMTAKCRIICERHDPVTFLPLEAVFERDGQPVVFPVGNRNRPREVTLGARNANHVIVLEGLDPGQRVLLHDPAHEAGDLGSGDGAGAQRGGD